MIGIENKGHNRILFIGPEIVKEFIECIIYEKALGLVLMTYCEDSQEIKNYNPASFDIVIESNSDQETKAKKLMGLSDKRVMSLW